MKIAIVGAGAVGGWLGVRLALAGHEVSVLARGRTLEAISRDGWKLLEGDKETCVAVAASDDPKRLGKQDIVVLSVKGPALEAIAPEVTSLISPSTTILPAMNGVPWWFLLEGAGELGPTRLSTVDQHGVIEAAFPYEQIVGSVVYVSADVKSPGMVRLIGGNRLVIGSPTRLSGRVPCLYEILKDAHIEAESSGNIRRDIWYKLWGNMTMNPISAFTQATCDRILDDPLVSSFVLAVMSEAQAVGRRIGCLIEERGEDRNALTRQLGAFKTSMLQDAEARRPLELDSLVAAPREIAKKLKLDTPQLDTLLGLSRLYARSNGMYP